MPASLWRSCVTVRPRACQEFDGACLGGCARGWGLAVFLAVYGGPEFVVSSYRVQ